MLLISEQMFRLFFYLLQDATNIFYLIDGILFFFEQSRFQHTGFR